MPMESFWGARIALRAAAGLLLGALAGCSDDPDTTTLPPPIPGNECVPAEQRCVDGAPAKLERCRTDGRGWISTQCAVGSSCDPASNTCVSTASSCTAGASRCTGSAGTAARQVCSADGAGWLNESCTGDLVCEQTSGSCQQAVCGAGESKCDGGPTDPERSVCAETRLAFESLPCADGASCVATPTGAKCVNRICTPGEVACSSDHLSVLTCDASGTSRSSTQACTATQVCMAGACVASSTPLGDIVVHEQGQELALGPGQYAIAVLDTSTINDVEAAFPAEVLGDMVDAPLPMPVHATTFESKLCASLELMRKARPTAPAPGGTVWKPEPAWPQSDETREFHVPDIATNGAVVFVRTGKLRAVGEHVNLWEDQTVSAPGTLLSDAVLAEVVSRLDDAVVPRMKVLSGEPTDVDANGRIDVLFTDLLPKPSAAAFVFPMRTLFPSEPGDSQVDFGEVVYVQGLVNGVAQGELMAIVAHEIQHLIYFGRRLEPYFADPGAIPDTIADDIYAVEGLATAAMAWSGQHHAPPMVAALEKPSEFSLWRLTSKDYLQEPSANFASYGYGALVQQYLMQQAGGIGVQGGGSLLVDQGGAAYFGDFTLGESGWARVAPIDGRTLEAWYADFAAALLVDGLEGKVSAATEANPLIELGTTSADPVWEGSLGPTLRYEWVVGAPTSGPILQRVPWSQRPSTLKAGGMSFLELAVGESGAKLEVTSPTAKAVVVRYDP